MLENDVAIDEREVGVSEWETFIGVNHVSAMRMPVERLGFLDHLMRDIDAGAVGKAARQRLREPANPASEIQRRPPLWSGSSRV